MLGKRFQIASRGNQRNQRKQRSQRGNAISEFGPAIWVLLICLFFPLLNVLGLSVAYGLCVVLNYNQVHEASLVPAADALNPTGIVKKQIPDQWRAGMGKFCNVGGNPRTDVGYANGFSTGGNANAEKIVAVRTTVKCKPFFSIPIPVVEWPGINSPMVFVLYSERPMENPDYAGSAAIPPPVSTGAPSTTSLPVTPTPPPATTTGLPPAPTPSPTPPPPPAGGPAGPGGPGGPTPPSTPTPPPTPPTPPPTPPAPPTPPTASGPTGPGGPSGPAGPGGPAGPAGPAGPGGPFGPGSPEG